METFGARLRRLRTAAGFDTQQSLAAAVHVTNAAVSLWEAELRRPGYRHLPHIAKALRVSEPYLRYGVRTASDVMRSFADA